MNPSGNQLVGMSKICGIGTFPHDITSKYVPFHMIDVIYASNQSCKTTQNWQKNEEPWTDPCTKQRQNEDGKKYHLSKFDFITQ